MSDEKRLEREVRQVIKLLKQTWPNTVDYNVPDNATDKRYAEVLDKNDKRIAWISERYLTNCFNDVTVTEIR